MKLKKKVVIPVVAVVAVAVALVPQIISAMGPKFPEVSATPLLKTDLANTVSVTGTVKSLDVTNVYSTLSYQIAAVNVEVGDIVKEGDVLCELDASSLTASIDQQTASLSQSQAQAQHNLAVAQNNLETEEYNQEYNHDVQITNAEISLETAKQSLEAAKLNLQSAESSLSSSRRMLREYRDEYGMNSSTYDEKEFSLRQEVRQGEITVEQYQNAVADAKKTVEDAEAGLKTARVLREEAIITSQQQVTSARIGADFTDKQMQLDEMRKDLEKTVVKAPVSGTVTAVLATEGSSGQGLLFVIEDTDKLKIETKIKEYDIASVTTGQNVKIKSDGTGDEEYRGVVSKIAPAAVKDATGRTIETTDVEFSTDIGVSGSTNLRIGMNARIDIITEERPDVFAVSYDAIVENEAGDQVVYVARPKPGEVSNADKEGDTSSGNSFIAVVVPITTGIESDFYIEVSSDVLKEGDLVISDPSGLTDGEEIRLTTAYGGVAGDASDGPEGAQVRVG